MNEQTLISPPETISPEELEQISDAIAAAFAALCTEETEAAR